MMSHQLDERIRNHAAALDQAAPPIRLDDVRASGRSVGRRLLRPLAAAAAVVLVVVGGLVGISAIRDPEPRPATVSPPVSTTPSDTTPTEPSVSEALDEARDRWAEAAVNSYRLTVSEVRNSRSRDCTWTTVVSDGVVTESTMDPSSTAQECPPAEWTVEELHDLISSWSARIEEFASPEFGDHRLQVTYGEIGVPAAMDYDLANGDDEDASIRVNFESLGPTSITAPVERAAVVRTPSNEVVAQIVTDRPLLATDNLEQVIDEVVQIEQLLVRRSYGECMVRQGFLDPDPPSTADVYRPQQIDLRYGALDVDRYSVALSEAVNREVRPEPVSLDGTRTSDEYLKAMNGSPSDYLSETVETPEGVFGFDLPGGCVGAAFEQIHGSREAKLELQKLVVLGQSLSNQSFDEMRQSSDVQIAIAAWSECMAKSGFEFADPWSIPVDDMTLDQRIETASTDVLCKAESGVVDAAVAAETAWQSAHFAEIDTITVQLSSLLDRIYLSM